MLLKKALGEPPGFRILLSLLPPRYKSHCNSSAQEELSARVVPDPLDMGQTLPHESVPVTRAWTFVWTPFYEERSVGSPQGAAQIRSILGSADKFLVDSFSRTPTK